MDECTSDLVCRCELEKEKIIALASDLIRIPSENPPGDLREMMAFIETWLRRNGVDGVRVLSADPTRPNLIVEVGKGTPVLILNGHADVVRAGDRSKWEFDPFGGEVKDGLLLGRGASDMKSGVAVIMYVLALLKQVEERLGGTVRLIIVPDEETGGRYGSSWLLNEHRDLLTADGCMIAEPSESGDGRSTVGQKGNLWVRFTAVGRSAHGSLAPYVGDNAILKLTKVIQKADRIRSIRSTIPDDAAEVMKASKRSISESYHNSEIGNVLDHVTVNIGTIKGGDAPNIVPPTAEMVWDMRVPIGASTDEVISTIREIVQDEVGVGFEVLERGEPNYTSTSSRVVQALAKNLKEVENKDLDLTYQWASSDAKFFRRAGTPTLQFGPSLLEGIHSFNEKVKVDDLVGAAKVYAATVIDFLNGQGE
jgi:succinyl-diaminopimelate desuccinylase